VVDVPAGHVPQVGMLGGHAQRRGGASPDEYRRMRSLDGFGVAERPGQVEVTAVEVERFGLGPQPPDDGARFGEAADRVRGVVEGQAVCLVLTPGHRVARPGAYADAEFEAPTGDDVDSRGDL